MKPLVKISSTLSSQDGTIKYITSTRLVVTYFALLIGTSLIAKGAPAFAWDVMDQWGRQAALFLNALNEGKNYSFDYVHPPTNYLILAFDSVWTANISEAAAGATWIIGMLALWQLIYLTSKHITGNSTVSALLSTAVTFTPLAENHALMWGYAELWMSLSIAAVTYLVASVKSINLKKGLPILVFTMVPALLKGSGPLISAVLVASILLAGVLARLSSLGRITLISSLIFVLIFASFRNVNVNLFGWDFQWYPSYNVIKVGDRGEIMSENPYHLIGFAFKHAYFVNQSYTVIFSAFLMAIPICIVESVMSKRSFLITFNLSVGIGIFLYYGIAMRVSDYFFSHAIPGNDVGLSRFSLYMLAPISAVVAHSISLASKCYPASTER